MTIDRKSTRLNSSHLGISYAVFCLKKKKNAQTNRAVAELHRLRRRHARTPLHSGASRHASTRSSCGAAGHASSGPLYFFFNDTATTEIYTLSLHDALPIFLPYASEARRVGCGDSYLVAGDF